VVAGMPPGGLKTAAVPRIELEVMSAAAAGIQNLNGGVADGTFEEVAVAGADVGAEWVAVDDQFG
jgi:hypothetical protein